MKKKLSLRFHIFFAFLLVFILSFSVIILTFNFIVNDYIRQDATDKLNKSIGLATAILQSQTNQPNTDMTNDPTIIFKNIISSIEIGSDVSAAIAYPDYSLKWPDAYTSPRVVAAAKKILSTLRESELKLGTNQLHKIRTVDNSIYYVVTLDLPQISISQTEPYYMLLFLDTSGYTTFAGTVNQILIIILIITLFTSLLVSFMVSNSIIKSINKLTAFASRIGAGIFSRQELNFADKELDALASDMNFMAERLDQADKEQKTFFQNASHELRTPLMSIQGYAEGIKYQVFEDHQAAADIIISESQRLTGMVENLLTISRMDTATSGRQEISKQIFDLREMISSVVENVRGAAILSHKNISVHFCEQEIHIYGNENDLFRAFENILSNGLRYAEDCVDISIQLKNQKQVEILIKDDGPGIDPVLLPNIFDRFYRGSDGKHGIGLALVKAIILQHKGLVFAANRDDADHGALFTVVLEIFEPD